MCRRPIGIASLAAACVTLFAQTAQADGLAVYPLRVDLTATQTASSIQLTNGDPAAQLIHARVFVWDQSGGTDKLTPARDIILSPPIFTLEPGTTQMLRLGLLDAVPPSTESAYRVVITEVPTSTQIGHIRLTLTLSIPVFVAPQNPAIPDLEVRAQRLDHRHVRLTFTNPGTAHVRVTDVRWRVPNSTHIEGQDPSLFYVLPGGLVQKTISFADSDNAGAVAIEAVSDGRTYTSLVQIQQP
jgi:fimbrial chaperone protein